MYKGCSTSMYLGRVRQPFKYVALSEIHSPSGKLGMGRWTWLPRYCWGVLLYKMMVDSCLHIDKVSYWIFVTKYQCPLDIGLPYHQWLCGGRLSCNQRQCIVRLLATPNTCEYFRILALPPPEWRSLQGSDILTGIQLNRWFTSTSWARLVGGPDWMDSTVTTA